MAKMLELFAGTSHVSKAFSDLGFDTFTIDYDNRFEVDSHADIGELSSQDILNCFGKPDVVWASPDCTTFSIAAISHHRFKGVDGLLHPKSDYAKKCDVIDSHVLDLIYELSPKYWFIENPRGGMRKSTFMRGLPIYTVTYCQYGDNRMKPTDIWTNHPCPDFKPMCHNGDSCHVSAPRGSRTGTQGRASHVERSMIPDELCEHIAFICRDCLD